MQKVANVRRIASKKSNKRQLAEQECKEHLDKDYYESLGTLPERLQATALKLFINKEQNEIVRTALWELQTKGCLE